MLTFCSITVGCYKRYNVFHICPEVHLCNHDNKTSINALSAMTKIAIFANRVDLDEVAHHEPPHLDPHCFSPSLRIINICIAWMEHILNAADVNFVD